MAMKLAQKYTQWLTLTTTQNLSDSAGTSLVGVAADFRGLNFYNPNSSNAWIQIFNAKAADVTLGTTTPILSFLIGATTERTINTSHIPMGAFGNGMSYAATTTQAGASTVSSGVTGRIFYWDTPVIGNNS